MYNGHDVCFLTVPTCDTMNFSFKQTSANALAHPFTRSSHNKIWFQLNDIDLWNILWLKTNILGFFFIWYKNNISNSRIYGISSTLANGTNIASFCETRLQTLRTQNHIIRMVELTPCHPISIVFGKMNKRKQSFLNLVSICTR